MQVWCSTPLTASAHQRVRLCHSEQPAAVTYRAVGLQARGGDKAAWATVRDMVQAAGGDYQHDATNSAGRVNNSRGSGTAARAEQEGRVREGAQDARDNVANVAFKGGSTLGAFQAAQRALDAQLAQESVEDKVHLHRTSAAMGAEAERDKAVRRALSREMSRPQGGRAARGGDPLARVSRRVTAANPLLDDD